MFCGSRLFFFFFMSHFPCCAICLSGGRWAGRSWTRILLRGKANPGCISSPGPGYRCLSSSQVSVKNAEHIPIQEMFKSRSGMLLLMSMAVLVAPLVEETVFRGYLYPVFARIASNVARLFG